MKKQPIVFKSAPGAFAHTLLEAETMTKKFRSTNLDFAIHKAIEAGWLFVMPAGKAFAYCRGTGPVGFEKVRLGGHEKQGPNGMPDWSSPRLLIATFSIVLVDAETREDERISIDISIPSRFTDKYVERSDDHSKRITRLEFVYSAEELRVWMKEKQLALYADAEKECGEEIKVIRDRVEELRTMMAGKNIPRQSPFGG